MRKFYLLSTLVLSMLLGSTSYAQDFSNKGKDFWVAYGYHQIMTGGGNVQEMILYFAAEQTANVTITIPGVGYSQSLVVPANTVVASATIPKTAPTDARLTGESTAPENKGIHITSDKPIVAYSHIYNASVSGASILYPTNTLGKEYYSINYKNISNTSNSNCWFYVIAADPGTTTVEITPSAATLNHAANIPFIVTLTQGQVYNIMGQFPNTGNPLSGVDLTGSKIQSINTGSGCKRIAVFSGSGRIAISCNGSAPSSDNYMSQAVPKAAWGKKYLTTPIVGYGVSNGNTNSASTVTFYRVCVSDPTTNVKINGVNIALPLLNNFYYEINSTAAPQLIEADKPILVAQYFPSQGASGCTLAPNPNPSDGDPEVIYLSPVEQSINKVLWNASARFQINPSKHYINAVIPNGGTAISSFKLDGVTVPASSFIVHPQDPAYSYVRLNVTSLTGSPTTNTGLPHIVQSDSGFNAIAYGYGGAESYGYNAGTNIKDIFQFISIQNQHATVNFPATCKGTPFYFSMTFPYQPDKIQWIFGTALNIMGIADITINNPAYDSTWTVAGKQLYRYKLPSPYMITTSGTYPIKVVATNPTPDGCGGIQDIDFDVQVFDPPVADFNFNTNGCVTSPVQFTDNSNTGPRPVVSRYWDFGDAASSIANNPSHTYAAPGSYDVKYSLVTDVGCLADTIMHTVGINNSPVAQFALSTPYCAGKVITFTDQSSVTGSSAAINKWTWDFGDGSPLVTVIAPASPGQTHTYAVAGPYTATLRVETATGCQSTLFSFPVTIHANPASDFSLPNVCLPAGAAQFNDLSTIPSGSITGWAWDFGDAGTATAPSPLHNYAAAGPYNVSLTVTSDNGCTNTRVKVLNTVYAEPQAAFTTAQEVCLGNAASFTDNSTAPASTVSQWKWDFGDGSPVLTVNAPASPNVSHTYASAGTYTVTLNVGSAVGCQTVNNFALHTVIVNPLPAVSFTSSAPYCAGSSIALTSTSVANAGSITNYSWLINSIPTGGNNASINFTPATPGVYPVILNILTDKGCSAQTTGSVTINPKPVSGFNLPGNICLPAGTANFTNTSTISDGSPLSSAWDFGDAGTSAATNPTHNYTGTGPYTVLLTITSNHGCTDMKSQLVNTIFAEPQAAFSVAPEVCLGGSINVADNSSAAGSTVSQWKWDFGDATAPVTVNAPASPDVSHTYASAGTYTIRLDITSAAGCQTVTKFSTHTVTVNPLPTGNFIFTNPSCETKTITFNDASLANAGLVNGWVWDFGDPASGPLNNTSPLQNPAHVYANTGTYHVTLIVTTNKGCTSILFPKDVVINPQPSPGFTLPEVCLSDAFAQFTDTSKIASGSIPLWSWNFGDPGSGPLNTSTTQNPQHHYTAIGNYNVTLTATSNNGCSSTISQLFTVNGSIPLANFNALNPATLCANDSVAIQDASSVNFGSITKVEIYWDYTGPASPFDTDDLPVPGKVYKHLYPNFQSPLTKTFTIRYRSYSGASCVNDRLKTIVVNAAPKVQFNNMPNVCLDAAPFQIIQASETGAVPGTGVFSGPGVTAGGIFNPASVGPGTYTITYTFTSAAGGCVDALSKPITVYPPPVADFAFPLPACETKAITFSDNSSTPAGTVTSWKWDFGDPSSGPLNNTSALQNPTHIFANWGPHVVKLNAITSNGCVSVQKVIPVTVNPQPRPNFTIPASLCLPNANVTLTNLSSIADGTASSFNYLWNFGDPASGPVNTSTGTNPSHTYVATGPFSINLRVTSGAGCVHDTTIALNTIHPQPIAAFTVDKPFVCIGDNFSFIDNSNPLDGTITQWNWTLADGNVKNNQAFTYTYTTAGTYPVSLFIFNSQGCRSSTATIPVTVYPYPGANAGPDKVVLEGGQVTLTPALPAAVNLTYLWSPNKWLNNSTIAYTIASPQDDITYTLKVTGDGGCSVTDDVFVKVLRAPLIPNIFSPNGDGVHDKWEIGYLESYPGCTVDIFNRYGQLIYHTVGYSQPWDGTVHGQAVPVGTYYYIVDPKNGRKQISGYVDVIR